MSNKLPVLNRTFFFFNSHGSSWKRNSFELKSLILFSFDVKKNLFNKKHFAIAVIVIGLRWNVKSAEIVIRYDAGFIKKLK